MKHTLFHVMVVLSLSLSVYSVNLVSNPGFETMEGTNGEYPSAYANWEGDRSEIITSENSITPYEGSQMLHFIYAAGEEGADSTAASQMRQLINISDYTEQITTGNATANLSAYFNRVLGNAQTDTQFAVRVDAFAGEVSNYVNLARNQQQLAYSITNIFSDSDTATWEFAQTLLLIPTNTDFLAIQVLAIEDIYNDTSGTEFDGHYCDMVSLEIIPEPTTLGLLALGTLLLRRKL